MFGVCHDAFGYDYCAKCERDVWDVLAETLAVPGDKLHMVCGVSGCQCVFGCQCVSVCVSVSQGVSVCDRVCQCVFQCV